MDSLSQIGIKSMCVRFRGSELQKQIGTTKAVANTVR